MAIAYPPIYQEVYYFLASKPSHEDILAFRPSSATQERLQRLLKANQDGILTPEEQSELDEFESLEHFVRMLKLHTQQLMDDNLQPS